MKNLKIFKRDFNWLMKTVKNLVDSSITQNWMKDFSTPDVETTTESQYQITSTKKSFMLTVSGTSTDIYLPTIENHIGLIVFIKNAGAEESAVLGNSLESIDNPIWEGGINMEQTSVQPGVVMRVYNDGNQWTVI